LGVPREEWEKVLVEYDFGKSGPLIKTLDGIEIPWLQMKATIPKADSTELAWQLRRLRLEEEDSAALGNTAGRSPNIP
jgi:hypothetical protein